MMNPLKWSVWLRIAVVASVLWTGGVFAHNYKCYGSRCRFHLEDLFLGLLPVCIFWGVAWIAHGIKLALIPADHGQKRDDRFIDNSNGTVLDTTTNLIWAAKDNRNDISWAKAKKYCENYLGPDWRMPTQDELAGLYDANKKNRYNYHVTALTPIFAEQFDIRFSSALYEASSK